MTRHRRSFYKQSQENGFVKMDQRHESHGYRVRNRRMPTRNTRTGKSQIHAYEIRSRRVRNKGFYTKYCAVGDGLVQTKEFCSNSFDEGCNENDRQYNATDLDDDDDGAGIGADDDIDEEEEDDRAIWTYRNACRDADWMPKSYQRNCMHHDDVGNDDDDANCDDVVTGKHAGTHEDCGYGYANHENDDRDVAFTEQACHGDQKPGGSVDDHDHDNDHEATHAHSYLDSAEFDYHPPDMAVYFRRKRRIMDSCSKRNPPEEGHDIPEYPPGSADYFKMKRRILKPLQKLRNKRCPPKEGSTYMASCICKKVALQRKNPAFPSWNRKKPRVLRKKWGETGNRRLYPPSTPNKAPASLTWQCSRSKGPHATAVGRVEGEPPLRPPTSPPAVSLSIVLEGLTKEFPDPEVTESLRQDNACNNQPAYPTKGARNSSAQPTQQRTAEDSAERERTQASMGKFKRKKHRPKVQRDIFHKAKSLPRKKAPVQGGDGLQAKKKVRKKRQAKKQDECGSVMESSTTSKKKRRRVQRTRMLVPPCDTLKENNQGTEQVCGCNKDRSIIPLASCIFTGVHDQHRDMSSLQNLLANEDVLHAYTHLAEGHLAPEFINYMQRIKPAFDNQCFGQIPPFIHEIRLPHTKAREELRLSCTKVSLSHSELDACPHLLLTQEPHDQLEIVAYNQKREMVVSKSTKLANKIRAKVQLGAENERMWPLLALGGIPTVFADVFYWKRERATMERQVDVFIQNMRSVLGDRHFSPWKGSILDSVVGAFLTQNVSDHLSSSAFISVVSRYPSQQGINTENVHVAAETPTAENQSASEISELSREMQHNVPNICKYSSSCVVWGPPKTPENIHFLGLGSSQSKATSECRREFTEQVKACSSLHELKAILRNSRASHAINLRDIEKKSIPSAPIRTPSRALTSEDDARHSSMQTPKSSCKEMILTGQTDNITSSIDLTITIPVDYIEQKSMHFEDRASSQLTGHENHNTTECRGQSTLNTSFHFLAEDHITKKSIQIADGIAADYTGQSDPEVLEEAYSQSPQQYTTAEPCINSISKCSQPSIIQTGQSDMPHLENTSLDLVEGGITNETIGTFISSPHDDAGKIGGLQHTEGEFRCSMEEKISKEQNDLHSHSNIVKQDLCKDDDNRPGKKCSSISIDVRCHHESVDSILKTCALVDCNDTDLFSQGVGCPTSESPLLTQCIVERCWPSPGPRTEVYHNSVCRSLFKNQVSVQINSKTSTLLRSNTEEQPLNALRASCTDTGIAVVKECSQIAYGSDVVYEVATPSIGNKKRRVLGGIERAHLEENQHGRKKNQIHDWESMRRQTLESCSNDKNMCEENLRKDACQDSVNWDAVRLASVEELADTIKERGMHHVLSGRIKAFLKTLKEEQGSLDLEWLRKVSPENAKAYLMGVRGLGVKSVECIRLLTLHHIAFPVDVNVGRICVRLGWVPIEPLPEELQLHLLELYPVQETIQKFLWPRLCTLDQKTLYELHYQLITFGKVFCTKSKPNCNACPMRTNCKHFASAYASAKLLLTGSTTEPPKEICSGIPIPAITNSPMDMEGVTTMSNGEGQQFARYHQVFERDFNATQYQPYYVEEPASPEEPRDTDTDQGIADIEDFPCIYGSLNDFTEDLLRVSELPHESMNGFSSCDHEEISDCTHKQITKKWGADAAIKETIKGSCSDNPDDQDSASSCAFLPARSASASCSSYNSDDPLPEKFPSSYQSIAEEAVSDTMADMSEEEEGINALISLPGAHIPAPKLKNIDRLRTIHYVYELPDDHAILKHVDIRAEDDPSFYLLAIWSPGEAPKSLQGMDKDCQDDLGGSFCGNGDETVPGTLLIPCRSAMRGRFPLNGTYFQVNEVFADHASSLQPFRVPRSHIWRLQRRFVYFGTSVSNIFRGLTSDEIRSCFLRGHVCMRGFDRQKRAPRPLVCRLHFPISKQIRQKKDNPEIIS